jgi:outer membrane protein assembly factor BamB
MTIALGPSVGCKGNTGSIRFVGLTNSPCMNEAPSDGGQASKGLILSGRVPLHVVPNNQMTLIRATVTTGNITLQDDEPPLLMELDTTHERLEGTVTLKVSAEDEDGNTYTTSIDICVDNLIPNLSLKSPSMNAKVWIEDSALDVRFSVEDASNEIEHITVSLGATNFHYQQECPIPISAPEGVCTIEPAKLKTTIKPGTELDVILTLMVRDKAGHEAAEQVNLKVGTHLLWQATTSSPVQVSAAILASNQVAVGTEAGTVIFFDNTGKETCRFNLPAPLAGHPAEVKTPLITNQDKSELYLATYDYLLAYKTSPCPTAPLWQVQAAPANTFFQGSRPVITSAPTTHPILYIGKSGSQATAGEIGAYDLSNKGAPLTAFPLTAIDDGTILSGPVLSEDGQTAFIGSADKNLYAINISDVAAGGDMVERWKFPTTLAINCTPLVTPNAIYIVSDTMVYAVDPGTGEAASGFVPFQSKYPFLSDVAYSAMNKMLAVVDARGKIYGLNEAGEELARLSIGAMGTGSTPVIGPNDIIYVGTKDSPDKKDVGRVYALANDLARVLWSFEPKEQGSILASPIIDENKILYIGSSAGQFYALDASGD